MWINAIFYFTKCYILLTRDSIGLGFPGGSAVKSRPASAGDIGDVDLIPGLGRFPGEGNGNTLQNSCLGNPMDREAWRAIVHGVVKSWTQLSDETTKSIALAKNFIQIFPWDIMEKPKWSFGQPSHRSRQLDSYQSPGSLCLEGPQMVTGYIRRIPCLLFPQGCVWDIFKWALVPEQRLKSTSLRLILNAFPSTQYPHDPCVLSPTHSLQFLSYFKVVLHFFFP